MTNVLRDRQQKYHKRAKRKRRDLNKAPLRKLGGFMWTLAILAALGVIGYFLSPYIMEWYRVLTKTIE